MNAASLIAELSEFRDELLDDIDGGEECQGTDQRLTARADLIDRAISAIRGEARFVGAIADAMTRP